MHVRDWKLEKLPEMIRKFLPRVSAVLFKAEKKIPLEVSVISEQISGKLLFHCSFDFPEAGLLG